jgi:hypothetical protein
MTTATDKLDEKFTSSFGVDASVPEPIDAGSTKRPADKTEGDPTPKSKMIADMVTKAYTLSGAQLAPGYAEFMKLMDGGTATAEGNRATIKAGGLKEDIALVFDGADLSEEFKDKATTIFEAAVHSRVVAETARLDEEFETKLQEAVASETAKIEEALDKYLDSVATKWLEENKLAVETGIRADVMENFMSGLRGLFIEHYIDIPEDKIDVVESLTSKVDELTTKLNESENDLLAKAKQIQEMTAASILDEVSEGLTDTQAEKLAMLAESVEFTGADEYRTKLVTIAEGYVAKGDKISGSEQLNEEVELVEEKSTPINDPLVAAVSNSIKKSVKK